MVLGRVRYLIIVQVRYHMQKQEFVSKLTTPSPFQLACCVSRQPGRLLTLTLSRRLIYCLYCSSVSERYGFPTMFRGILR
jgi:hypothetical protein